MNQELAAAWELVQAAGADPLEVAAACERIKAFVDARQLSAINEVVEQDPEFLDQTGRVIDPATAEIATALRWTPGTAAHRVDLAQDLLQELPCVHDALRFGRLDLGKATEIARGTCELHPTMRFDLARSACDYAAEHTRGQLRAWLARRLAKLDPDAADRRRRKAQRRRRIWIQPERDGMATVGAYLSAEEAQACFQAIQHKVSNHEGPVDAARADVFVALLTGIEVGAPVPVQVIVTSDGPELDGHGPISTGHLADLSQYASRLNLERPVPTIGYRPGVRLARWVRTSDRHCRFPGCRRPARQCDLDHVIPWPAGSTAEHNLASLCRHHHRLKTHTQWKVQSLPDRTLQWTSPRGRLYFSYLEDP